MVRLHARIPVRIYSTTGRIRIYPAARTSSLPMPSIHVIIIVSVMLPRSRSRTTRPSTAARRRRPAGGRVRMPRRTRQRWTWRSYDVLALATAGWTTFLTRSS